MNKIYTTILMSMFALCSMAQNPASTVLSTSFDEAFNDLGSNPKGWVSANLLTPGIISAVTPGYAGSISAAKIETKTLGLNPAPAIIPTTSGILLSGKLVQVGFSYTIVQGVPYTNKPEGMAYWAKYAPVGTDTGFAYVLLTKWNTTTLKRDTVGIAGDTISSAIATWTKRLLPILYNSTTITPDTLSILFSSSSRTAAQVGTVMHVDELFLYLPTQSNISEKGENEMNIYPNPASNILYLKNYSNESSSVVLRDMLGRVILTEKLLKNDMNTISLNEVPVGVYLLSSYNSKGEILQTKKLSVIR